MKGRTVIDEPTATIEIPATLREDLQAYADSHGTTLETLVRAWLQDRLVHEDEKERGVARKVKP
jgi:hypothetical protein